MVDRPAGTSIDYDSRDHDEDDDERKMTFRLPSISERNNPADVDSLENTLHMDTANPNPQTMTTPTLTFSSHPAQPGVSPDLLILPRPSHQRKVSWDRNLVDESLPTATTTSVATGNSPIPASILQIPQLENYGVARLPMQDIPEIPPKDSSSTTSRLNLEDIVQQTPYETEAETYILKVLEHRDPMPPYSTRSRSRSLSNDTGVSLDDVPLNLEDIVKETPYEAEAETYILKVLEQRDPTPSQHSTRSRSSDTGAFATSVLSHVPDDISHNFCNPEDYHKDNENDADNDVVGEITTKTQQTPVSSDINSENSAASPHRSPSRTDGSVRDRSRQRNETVEQTLFGLTSALNAMNTLADTPHDPVAAWDTAFQNSSAEQLAVNASILFQRKKNDAPTPDDDSSMYGISDLGSTGGHVSLESIPTINTGRWTALRTAAVKCGGILKRNEDEGLVTAAAVEEVPGGDEEQGNNETEQSVRGGVENTRKTQYKENPRRPRFSFAVKIKEEREYARRFQHFRNPLTSSIYLYCKVVLLYLILPATGIAAILFHFADNPPTGYDVINVEGPRVRSPNASASWWLLFLGVRQVITAMMAKGTELIVIDFLSMRVRTTLRLLGPWITLMIIQSKGWPFLIFAWGMYDFCLLYGDHPFYDHWLYWQDTVDMFTEKNPAGGVLFSETNRRVLVIAVSVGIVVAVKRFWLALLLGKQTFGE
jgi:hypothetical protein